MHPLRQTINAGAVFCFLVFLIGRTDTLAAVVTTTADSGAGSLRAIVPTGGTITFDPTVFSNGQHTITLLSALPNLIDGTTIIGPGPKLLTVKRGAGAPAFRVFTIPAGTVSISGLTIDNGLAQGTNGTTFSNVGAGLGGGISNSGTLTLSNCVLSNNSAKGGKGADGSFTVGPGVPKSAGFGGAANGGAIYSAGSTTLTLTNCTLQNNSALGGVGGNNNQAGTPADPQYSGFGGEAFGGALFGLGATVSVTSCTFASNTASGGAGGAASNTNGVGNSGAETYGGAVAANATFTNCTFSANSVHPGMGGTGADAQHAGTSSFGAGGGIYGDVATLTNCTLTGNRVFDGINGDGSTTDQTGEGGGIWLGSNTTLRNNIIADNIATGGPDAVGTFAGDYNLIRNGTGWSFSPAAAHNKVNVDPLLDPAGLKDNGGPTATIAITSGSPALNAGDDATAAAVDQRGFARSGMSDMGAFELSTQLFAVTVVVRNGANFTVTFPATNTHVYRLERATTLTPPNWQSIPNVNDVTANSTGPLSITDPTSNTQTKFFYHVRVIQ